MNNLKPCPFCGAQAKASTRPAACDWSAENPVVIECGDLCLVGPHIDAPTLQKAGELWNSRPSEAGLLAACKAFLQADNGNGHSAANVFEARELMKAAIAKAEGRG